MFSPTLYRDHIFRWLSPRQIRLEDVKTKARISKTSKTRLTRLSEYLDVQDRDWVKDLVYQEFDKSLADFWFKYNIIIFAEGGLMILMKRVVI